MQYTPRCISCWHTYTECHRREVTDNKDTSGNRNSYDGNWWLSIENFWRVPSRNRTFSLKFILEKNCIGQYIVY